jgi:hypothetical protein
MPNGAEIMGWFEYLRMDDEERARWMAYAMSNAFHVAPKKQTQVVDDDEDDEVIDTTSPEFLQNFKGFTNTPVTRKQQGF